MNHRIPRADWKFLGEVGDNDGSSGLRRNMSCSATWGVSTDLQFWRSRTAGRSWICFGVGMEMERVLHATAMPVSCETGDWADVPFTMKWLA